MVSIQSFRFYQNNSKREVSISDYRRISIVRQEKEGCNRVKISLYFCNGGYDINCEVARAAAENFPEKCTDRGVPIKAFTLAARALVT
jgi:hypothetical protein